MSESTCARSGSLRRADEGNLHRHAYQIFDLNLVAWFDVAADSFRANPGVVNLAIRVVEIREEHVPRHLSVDAHGLDPLQYSIPSTLEHLTSPAGGRGAARPAPLGSTVAATTPEVTKGKTG